MGRQRTRRPLGASWAMALLAVLMAGAPAWAARTGRAVAVVRQFQGTLITVMKAGKSLGFEGRYRKLMPAVRASHDLPYIAELALGPYWDKLSLSEHRAFVTEFARLTVATYAAQFRRYSGQAFRRTASQAVAQGDVVVETELMTDGHKEATIDYLVAPSAGRWRIVNIVANGVSDLALKRAQYTAIIRKQGFPVLLSILRAKVTELSHGAPKR